MAPRRSTQTRTTRVWSPLGHIHPALVTSPSRPIRLRSTTPHRRCDICHVEMALEEMMRHVHKVHVIRKTGPNNKRRYQCPTCHQVFDKRNHFDTHYKKHYEIKDCICDLCDFSSSHSSSRSRHKRDTHEGEYEPQEVGQRARQLRLQRESQEVAYVSTPQETENTRSGSPPQLVYNHQAIDASFATSSPFYDPSPEASGSNVTLDNPQTHSNYMPISPSSFSFTQYDSDESPSGQIYNGHEYTNAYIDYFANYWSQTSQQYWFGETPGSNLFDGYSSGDVSPVQYEQVPPCNYSQSSWSGQWGDSSSYAGSVSSQEFLFQ